MISCTGAASNDGTTILMDRPYMAEIRTLMYPDGGCITQAENEATARDLLREPSFRNALRQVIDIRQNAAWLLGGHRMVIEDLQAAIEARMPDVGLPIASMELISWPTVTTEDTERQNAMQRTGTHTWETTAELADGFIKFRGNDDWSINWGAPFPYMIDAPGLSLELGSRESRGRVSHGVATLQRHEPARAGRYLPGHLQLADGRVLVRGSARALKPST